MEGKNDSVFAVDDKTAGIIMAVIGGFCIVSGLCQKVAESEDKRQWFLEALREVQDSGTGERRRAGKENGW